MQIEMRGIDKSFGGNAVLKNAGFLLDDGEVHALMGENGAGKSTLMKILTGVYTKDAGQVIVDGKEVCYNNPQEAEKAGIVFIHQELNVLFDLTVEENMFLGKEIKKVFGICDRKAMRKRVQEILDMLGVDIDPTQRMDELSIGQQQMIEIAKALMVDAKVLIMDEPTAALTQSETEVLFKVVNSLRKKGVSIVYISHRMEEIFELCDRITILRDGTYIDTKRIADIDMNDIVKMMIGREIGERYPVRNSKIGDVAFEVKNLNCPGAFENVSFEVRAGEVLGVSGLMGAGRTEIMQAIFGNMPNVTGQLLLDGKEIKNKNPQQAIQNGIGFITEDRKVEGLMLEESIMKNISLANLGRISNGGVINKKKEQELVNKGIEELRIRCFGPQHECNNLSGGNQQKVIFAKWIYTNPKVLILDEPTRGVDIGAKKEIYNIINELAAKGVAIIMVSSELPEVLGMSDRVMVVREGEVRGILNKEEANQESIMTLATGGELNGK
ncbi:MULTISPECIES: sugar ABC transporter ATP-binding protein [Clostridia]|uniref:sugar ABC transporter ATP-binding protein n=1 Tax=Clostridia TaxID=186801 RepID=UPI0018AB6CB3|nr:sugar ABC transporter ATP-binding protein [Clostridium sp. 1001270J_160509_D11]